GLRGKAETGEVSLRAAVVASRSDPAAARRLAHAALLQTSDALRAADALAIAMPGATLLVSSPVAASGVRPSEHAEAWRAYASRASALAPGLEQAVSRLHDVLARPASDPGGAWRGVTRAAPGPGAELSPRARPREGGAASENALFRLSGRQPHPRLGAGLVSVLVPPPALEPDPARAPATAALLNEGEAREPTPFDALGGWCVHPDSGLAHVSFVPALAVEDHTAALLARHAAERRRWAASFLADVARVRSSGHAAAPRP